MVIVCGIDGSANSRAAARAAAAIASLSKDALNLVYVQEALVVSAGPIVGDAPVALANTAFLEQDRQRMKVELEREARQLSESFHVEVTHTIRTGLPDHELERVAKEDEARLLVVASLGRRAATMWRFGSVADRLSQSTSIPLLVVREPQPFERWAREGGALAVVTALGRGRPSEAARRAARGLLALRACQLTEAHVYDPEQEARRLGLIAPESSDTRFEIERVLTRELAARGTAEGSAGAARFVPLASRGHVAETLAEYVDEVRADLLVIGTNQHGALHRRFLGSVSYAVLPMVETNVLIVPTTAQREGHAAPRSARNILVATDLSEVGNSAVDLAFQLAPAGGRLVLLHVDVPPELPAGWITGYHPGLQPTPGERRQRRALAAAELEKLAHGRDPGLAVEVEVVEASDVARAILEAGERHGADLVCLGTHRYGRVTTALIGSVARTVARRSARPVLLVPSQPGS